MCARQLINRLHLTRNAALVLLVLLLYAGCAGSEVPSFWDEQTVLYPGIRHVRLETDQPVRMVINCLQIDTQSPGLGFYTTERSDQWVLGSTETMRQTTTDFIRASQDTDKPVVVAINATPWEPWPAPYNEEALVNLSGFVVSEGLLVSSGNGRPAFIVYNDHSVGIEAVDRTRTAASISLAVSGFRYVLRGGEVIGADDVLHPRTAIGVCADSRYVYWMTIDGRQLRSSGATIEDVGSWLQYFGAYDGINMDGGGSTTMAWWNPELSSNDKVELLNFPVGAGGLPLWPSLRTNGNNIGVYLE